MAVRENMSKLFLRMLFGGAICLALLTTCSFGQGHAYGKEQHQNNNDRDDNYWQQLRPYRLGRSGARIRNACVVTDDILADAKR
jgi:hypothetical protein